ncbi:hypothetical protein KP509_21G035000 [Ceratopteris richardii]|uniref:Uncharacterized protein n=1 Tax=Ceratopteris richardii TaxID=49495 RepID=A0A8T2SC78_CERRI|nr:hypothetical protein KP509_21G035000 [Ceratopteris richardii]
MIFREIVYIESGNLQTESFEEQSNNVRIRALLFAMMYMVVDFLRVTTLTFATSVLLGGFVSELTSRGNKILESAWQIHIPAKADLILACLYVAIAIRLIFFSLPYDVKNLVRSLSIFYILSATTSIIGYCSGSYRLVWRDNGILESSMIEYFDFVFREVFEHGLAEASKLQFRDFVFTKISDSLKQCVHPLVIRQTNMKLIDYLYNERGGVGMACEYMKSGDMWKRAAAASLPGFWVMENRIRLQKGLFWRLRETMCGWDKDAEAALNSLHHLAAAWSNENSETDEEHPFLEDDPMARASVVDTLVNLILKKNRPTLYFQMKALAACCRHPLVLQHFYQQHVCELSTTPGTSECTSRSKIGRELEALVTITSPLLAQNQSYTVSDQRRSFLQTSRLTQLCMQLHDIVCDPNNTACIISNVYASESLLSLICHGNGSIQSDTMHVMVNIAEGTIRAMKQKLTSIDLDEVKAIETVRCLLSLDQFNEWGEFEITGLRNGSYKIIKSSKFVEAVVKETRERVMARMQHCSEYAGNPGDKF